MINKVLVLIFGNIKLVFIKLFHFNKFRYNLYNNVHLSSDIEISKNGKFCFGKKFILGKNTRLSVNGECIVGDYCGINRNCYIVCHDKIKIGNNVIIGPNTIIVDHDHKFDREGIKKKEFKTKEIIIEDGAWIGANCVILKGSKIGKNSIISAGSTVNFDVPDNTILVQKKDSQFIEIK